MPGLSIRIIYGTVSSLIVFVGIPLSWYSLRILAVHWENRCLTQRKHALVLSHISIALVGIFVYETLVVVSHVLWECDSRDQTNSFLMTLHEFGVVIIFGLAAITCTRIWICYFEFRTSKASSHFSVLVDPQYLTHNWYFKQKTRLGNPLYLLRLTFLAAIFPSAIRVAVSFSLNHHALSLNHHAPNLSLASSRMERVINNIVLCIAATAYFMFGWTVWRRYCKFTKDAFGILREIQLWFKICIFFLMFCLILLVAGHFNEDALYGLDILVTLFLLSHIFNSVIGVCLHQNISISAKTLRDGQELRKKQAVTFDRKTLYGISWQDHVSEMDGYKGMCTVCPLSTMSLCHLFLVTIL